MNAAAPFFSIILPTYNRANLIEKAIKSVLEQAFVDWELLIIDDGSTDNTQEVVEQFEDSRIHYLRQDHGERSRARNLGVQRAEGRYVCFLDDDDYLLPHFLQGFHHYFQNGNSEDLILRTGFCRALEGQLLPATNYDEKQHRHPVRFAAFHMCSASSLCIPRKIMLQYSFPEHIHFWEDSYLILRLLAQHPMVQLPSHHYVYVIHQNMSSRQFYQSPELAVRVEENVQTIADFFEQHGKVVQPFLPSWTQRYLIADKYLDHAIASLPHTSRVRSFQFVKKSLRLMYLHPHLLRKQLSWLYRAFLQ